MTSPAEFGELLRSLSTSQSSARENLVEHMFLAECLQESWFRRRESLEVARAEVDAGGYDLILRSAGVTRYVQLKASWKSSRTSRQTVNANLQELNGGCIIWVVCEVDEETGRADLTYLWREGANLGNRVGRHTRGAKSERPNTRVLSKREFEHLESTAELLDRLFRSRRKKRAA